ncbi:MAG: hypothetical protein HY924_14705 [Elusimicrobia bacterium]|nr:hypothetical protein [Elusimicrobiota bacterium]
MRAALSAFLVLLGVGMGLRVSAGLTTDTLAKLRDSGRADYLAFSRSLKETGVLGWSGHASAFRGPVYPLFLASVESFDAGRRPASPLIEAGLCSLEMPLAGWLAWGLAGPWAGVAAAALTSLHPALSRPLPAARVEPLYGFLLLLSAAGAAAWARKPTMPRAAAAGLCIGLGLLCRSVLVLFPLILAAVLALGVTRPFDWKRSVWVLIGAAYLSLLPWTVRNWSQFGRFIPLEDHAADRNLIAAVDGVIENLEGPSPDGGPEIPFDELGTRRQEALARIVRDPLPYLASTLERLGVMASWHGPLLLLAGLGFLRRRDDPVVVVLALMAGTFVLMHAPLSLEKRYLEPILPVLAVLAGCGVLDWLKSAGPRSS